MWRYTYHVERVFWKAIHQAAGVIGMSSIPESYFIIGIITAIPVVGLIVALVAARIPSTRPDS